MSNPDSGQSVERFAPRGNCKACDGTGDSRKIPHPIGVAWNSTDMGCRECDATGSVSTSNPEQHVQPICWNCGRTESRHTSGHSCAQGFEPMPLSNPGESVMPADKGLLNGACNRSACLARPATWWNKSTRAHYCEPCAKIINEYNAEDAKRLYNAPLCEPVKA